MYKFELPIGDWSDDGHGQCEWFLIESNKPVDELREIYFETKKNLQCSLDGSDWNKMRKLTPCDDYGDNNLTKEHLVDFLKLNLTERDIKYFTEDPTPEKFAELFILFMVSHNSELELQMVERESFPMFPFYGFDKQKRHIGFMGYGLFY